MLVLTLSDNLCLFIGIFIPLALNVINDIVGFGSNILLFIFCLSLCVLFLCSPLSVFFWILWILPEFHLNLCCLLSYVSLYLFIYLFFCNYSWDYNTHLYLFTILKINIVPIYIKLRNLATAWVHFPFTIIVAVLLLLFYILHLITLWIPWCNTILFVFNGNFLKEINFLIFNIF